MRNPKTPREKGWLTTSPRTCGSVVLTRFGSEPHGQTHRDGPRTSLSGQDGSNSAGLQRNPPPWEPADDAATAAKFPVFLEREMHHPTHACQQTLHPSKPTFVLSQLVSAMCPRATCVVGSTLSWQLLHGRATTLSTTSREEEESVEQPLLWDEASSMRPKQQHPGQKEGIISILCSASLRSGIGTLPQSLDGRCAWPRCKLHEQTWEDSSLPLHARRRNEPHHSDPIPSLIRAGSTSWMGSGSDHDGSTGPSTSETLGRPRP